jgi:hypothetical protein
MKKQRSSKSGGSQTLLQAAGYPGKARNVFGVILDATGHYKTDDSIDYVTRLKVIDHSLNNAKKPYRSEMESFVYVFIFSETVADAPQIGRLGDIIRLQGFEFDSYQRVIKAVHHKKRSSWSIFDGRKNANMRSIMASQGNSSGLSENEKTLLHKLRVWRDNYFQSRSIYGMSWFKRAFPDKTEKNKIYELKDVDIVVRLVQDINVRIDESFYHKMVFVDKLKNMYFAELKGLLTGIDKGDVMKLRSVTLIRHNNEYKIEFATYSNFMVLQKNFRDAKEILEQTRKIKYNGEKLKNQFFEELHLGKRNREQIGPNSYVYLTSRKDKTPLNMELVRKNFEDSYPILRNFVFESSDLAISKKPAPKRGRSKSKGKAKAQMQRGSCILKEHADLPVTPLKDLTKILNSKSKKKSLDKFRVRANIKTIENHDFNSNFKIYSDEKKKTWELTTKKRKFVNDEKVIFYNVFGLKDDTLGSRDAPVPAYLITYNENPKYIFDLWRMLPDPLIVGDWLKLDAEKKKQFEQNLAGTKAKNKEFDLVLQLVEAEGGRTYLKLIDSIFWFQD